MLLLTTSTAPYPDPQLACPDKEKPGRSNLRMRPARSADIIGYDRSRPHLASGMQAGRVHVCSFMGTAVPCIARLTASLTSQTYAAAA
jgi:hypothetical protein